jgi:chorismate mutase/prephenate dehydrogenase
LERNSIRKIGAPTIAMMAPTGNWRGLAMVRAMRSAAASTVPPASAEALEAVRELFAPTMAEQVVMSLDDHDRLIAYVLGLSHALNIAFFTALAESGEAAPRLACLSSTTFDAQLDVASRVARDNPELYYEIQSLNDYGAESLEALSQAVERIRTAVLSQDHDAFVALMRRGRDYLEDRKSLTERRA